VPARRLLWEGARPTVVVKVRRIERQTPRRPTSPIVRCGRGNADQHDGGVEGVEGVVLDLPPAGRFLVVDDDPAARAQDPAFARTFSTASIRLTSVLSPDLSRSV
jgi:hypothetical protein